MGMGFSHESPLKTARKAFGATVLTQDVSKVGRVVPWFAVGRCGDRRRLNALAKTLSSSKKPIHFAGDPKKRYKPLRGIALRRRRDASHSNSGGLREAAIPAHGGQAARNPHPRLHVLHRFNASLARRRSPPRPKAATLYSSRVSSSSTETARS